MSQSPVGYLAAWPADQDWGGTSVLNLPNGGIVANGATIQASVDGAISISVSEPADVIVDVSGYYLPIPLTFNGVPGPAGPPGQGIVLSAGPGVKLQPLADGSSQIALTAELLSFLALFEPPTGPGNCEGPGMAFGKDGTLYLCTTVGATADQQFIWWRSTAPFVSSW